MVDIVEQHVDIVVLIHMTERWQITKKEEEEKKIAIQKIKWM